MRISRPERRAHEDYSDSVIWNPASLNTFSYVENRPVDLHDPSGRNATAAGAAAGTVIEPGAGTAVGAAIGALLDTLAVAGLTTAIVEEWKRNHPDNQDTDKNDNVCHSEEHTKGARPSTEAKHQQGKSRKKRDRRGGEKGDERRPHRGGKPNPDYIPKPVSVPKKNQ